MKRKRYTNEQMRLQKILREMGFETILEYAVKDYSIDIYLPEFNLGIEYDGPMHSLSKKRDANRDYDIFMETGIRLMRIRKTDADTKKAIMNFIEGKE
jgi:very-short-patch-repair endonuclease